MSETIGQKLKSSREEKRLSLDQVSAATRIRPHYLEALERDDLSAIPSAAQARGFLRIYTDFLGLDADSIMPMARPVEPQPIVSSPDVPALPSAGLRVASVQGPPSTPASARPNLLTSLRDRFTRRSNTENPVVNSSRDDVQPVVPEPEFVPARYTEELPAEPAPVVIEEPVTKEEPTRPVKRSPGKKASATKKSASAKVKTSPRTKKSEVKKKMTKLSRPKHVSSSHKPSSLPTRCVTKKM
jgi:transcriptional regulator with XRE-family HTH domain